MLDHQYRCALAVHLVPDSGQCVASRLLRSPEDTSRWHRQGGMNSFRGWLSALSSPSLESLRCQSFSGSEGEYVRQDQLRTPKPPAPQLRSCSIRRFANPRAASSSRKTSGTEPTAPTSRDFRSKTQTTESASISEAPARAQFRIPSQGRFWKRRIVHHVYWMLKSTTDRHPTKNPKPSSARKR